jgi:hypothetical protein
MKKTLTDLTHRVREDWRWRFLEMLAKSSSVSTACTHAGVSRETANKHRQRFPKFSAKWDEALEIATEVLEVECRIRCLDRSDGESARLLTFLLQAHRPEKYRDASKVKAPPASVESETDSRSAPVTADDRAEAERELVQWRAKQKAEIERLVATFSTGQR